MTEESTLLQHKNIHLKSHHHFFHWLSHVAVVYLRSSKLVPLTVHEVWVWASTLVWSGAFTRTCGSVCWFLVKSDGLCCVLLCQFVSVCVCDSSVWGACLCSAGLELRLHLLHRSLMSRSPCTRHLMNSAELVCELSRKLDTEKIMWSDCGL